MDFNILRENDIRGDYPSQVNKEVAKRLGLAFGTYLRSKDVKEVVIGHDNRLSGEELHAALIDGIIATGINVLDIGLATSPLYNFSSIQAKIPYGIIVTASHNKASDNGFKIFGENYLHLTQEELNKVYDLIREESFVSGIGQVREGSYLQEYVDMLISKVKLDQRLKVVVDCGHGTTSILAKDVFNNLNVDVTYLYAESDGSFPARDLDPNDEENLVTLRQKMLEIGADLGIAFDGDGDRVGILDENGNMIVTDILMAILAADIIPKTPKKNIIYDVKCSKALEIELRRIGANGIMKKNGSAYIENEIFNADAMFGGEYSGHIYFRDDYYGFDDGIYAGIRVIELLSRKNIRASETYAHIEKFYNTPEIRVSVSDDKKWNVIEKIKEYATHHNYDFSTIDGIRVNYNDGFSLIRCSNTGPQITLRFEARTEEALEYRKREFLNLVEYLIK